MNRYPFNQCYLRLARGLMAFGAILITSKVAMADVISLSVDKTARLEDNNTAIVTGEVACSDGEVYNMSAFVAQNLTIGIGTLVPVFDFEDYPPCSGSPIRFEISVRTSGTFEPGEADARVTAQATDFEDSDTQTVDTTLELVGP